jgi:hypothetical protein
MRFFAAWLVLSPMLAFAWSPERAFQYLEMRQQQWMDWKPAMQKSGVVCVSCHTGLPYLMARQALHVKTQRPLEQAITDSVKARLLASDPPAKMLSNAGVDAVMSLTILSRERTKKDPLRDEDRAALKWLTANQLPNGAWTWFKLDAHPVESDHSDYFGAALAMLALRAYPEWEGAAATREFLRREAQGQPLHNRIAVGDVGDLWAVQSADGGWTSASLGPWKAREAAPPDSGSNAYATAWAAFAARQSGVSCSDARLKRALSWLEKRQNPETGAWESMSMNKVFPADSMQVKFMTDAATGYAAAALLSCKAD